MTTWLPSCVGTLTVCMYLWFVSISCPVWEFLLFCRSLSKILINSPHSPSFLPLAIHTWWQEDRSHCSQDPISRLPSSSVLPKPNWFICKQKKNCIKHLKTISQGRVFTNKLRFTLNVYYAAADEQFTHSQVNVSDFIHFFHSVISLWNAELLTTFMSVLKAHILLLSSKPFYRELLLENTVG